VELDRDGYSPAQCSKEFAALVEVLACELYSAIDGGRRALYGTYKGVKGIRKDSNDKAVSGDPQHHTFGFPIS
jgi:hypothetical protein